jgi:hypothetical protein
MVTSADGKQEFYSDMANGTKNQSREEAVELDKKLINSWLGHPHFSIIDNKKQSFQSKIDKCVESVCNYVGLPTPTSFYKKFLLKVSGNYEVTPPINVWIEYF